MTKSAPEAQAGSAKTTGFGERYGLGLLIVPGFLLFLAVFAFVPNLGVFFRIYSVPSGSMEPNYRIGSYFIINRAAYGFSAYSFDWFRLPVAGRWPEAQPKRGDVVLFQLPRDPSQNNFKRVLGLPGDKIYFKEDWIFLNGELLPRMREGEVAITWQGRAGGSNVPLYRETLPDGTSFTHAELLGDRAALANTEEFLVPPGHLFVIGDNRDNATDSRLPAAQQGVGFVPVENVVGKVVLSFGGGK